MDKFAFFVRGSVGVKAEANAVEATYRDETLQVQNYSTLELKLYYYYNIQHI